MSFKGGGAGKNPLFKGLLDLKIFRFNSKQYYGFTLSEVLITLGIIGIVAAMTLPGLIKDYNKKVIALKIKKIYTVLQNGTNLSISQNGDLKDWYGENAFQNGFDGAYKLYSLFIKPYYNIMSECVEGANNVSGYKKCGYKENRISTFDGRLSVNVSNAKIPVVLNDGSILIFSPIKADLSSSGSGVWAYYWLVYYDVNGGKMPNRLGKDIFLFELSPYTNKVSPTGIYRSISATNLIPAQARYEQCITHGRTCAGQILIDNWKITYY